MKNTIIAGGQKTIDSREGWCYRIDAPRIYPTSIQTEIRVNIIAEKTQQRKKETIVVEKVSILTLRKTVENDRPSVIGEIINEACSVLVSLIAAIERGDEIWKVPVIGTEISPSGSKTEPTDEEPIDVPGTTIKPSKC